MARATRVDFPGARYHVLNRGTERRSIFYSRRCYERFIELLSILPQRFGVALHGYALMSNHYHLQLENREANLSQAIQWPSQRATGASSICRRINNHTMFVCVLYRRDLFPVSRDFPDYRGLPRDVRLREDQRLRQSKWEFPESHQRPLDSRLCRLKWQSLAAIDPRLSKSEPCTSKSGRLIDAVQCSETSGTHPE